MMTIVAEMMRKKVQPRPRVGEMKHNEAQAVLPQSLLDEDGELEEQHYDEANVAENMAPVSYNLCFDGSDLQL